MTPKRFALKVADRMGYTGEPIESRATSATAADLGWLVDGKPSTACPPWFQKYRDLIYWRECNEAKVAEHQGLVAKCQDMLEKLYDSHA